MLLKLIHIANTHLAQLFVPVAAHWQTNQPRLLPISPPLCVLLFTAEGYRSISYAFPTFPTGALGQRQHWVTIGQCMMMVALQNILVFEFCTQY